MLLLMSFLGHINVLKSCPPRLCLSASSSYKSTGDNTRPPQTGSPALYLQKCTCVGGFVVCLVDSVCLSVKLVLFQSLVCVYCCIFTHICLTNHTRLEIWAEISVQCHRAPMSGSDVTYSFIHSFWITISYKAGVLNHWAGDQNQALGHLVLGQKE